MPSPFPGMDPYIECQRWEDFHTSFISGIRDVLVSKLRPRYDVGVEIRVYVERRDFEQMARTFVADVGVTRPHRESNLGSIAIATESAIEARDCLLPWPQEHREPYLVLRRPHDSEVITVLELLSPTNKLRRANGRELYLEKRMELLQTTAHLVELDLLRGGERMPFDSAPDGDYFALISRAKRRPIANVYGWPLAHRLPLIPIPLANGTPDVELDLQVIFNDVYDRAGYDYALDYGMEVSPSFSESEKKWAAILLSNKQSMPGGGIEEK